MWQSSGSAKGVFLILASSICIFNLTALKLYLYFQIPKGRDVDDKDEFVFNDEFSAPLYRIKVIFP